MIDLPRIVRRVTAWLIARPTDRRIGRIKARRAELKARIEFESRNHRRVSHLTEQLQAETSELLRLERRRIA